MNPEELPPGARRAFENYPQLEASPAFNRAVLESLEAARAARQLTLVGRLEEFLGLKWWQFAASGLLGAFVPAVVLGALLLSSRGAAPLQSPAPTLPNLPGAIGPLYARELWLRGERPARPLVPHAPASDQTDKGEELSCVESKSPLV